MLGRRAMTLAIVVMALSSAVPSALRAQSTSDFRLQPAASSTPRAQGPVDPDNPVVRGTPARPPAPAPVATPAEPAPTPTPAAGPVRPAPSASAAPATGRPTGAIPAPRPSPSASPSAPPQASASATPSAAPQSLPSTASSPAPTQTATTAVPSPELPAAADTSSHLWAWLLALGIGLAALIAWWLHGRRDAAVSDDWDDHAWLAEPEGEVEPEPAVHDTVADLAAPSPAELPLAADPAPTPKALATQAITLSLEPIRLTATLTSTSLSYRLAVTNQSARPLAAMAVAGSMVAAHASLPVENQLATDGQMLALLHEIPALAPGETAELTGDLRLPLPDITPIRSGNALLFIPLARFRAECDGTTTLAAFVVGETPPVAAAALLPFRIDMGPRIWPNISKRRLDAAAAMPVR